MVSSFQQCKAPASLRHQHILEVLYNLRVLDDLPGESKRDFHKFKLAIPFIDKEKYDWKEKLEEERTGISFKMWNTEADLPCAEGLYSLAFPF